MKFGIHQLLFGDRLDRSVLDSFAQIKDIGYDGIEIPIFDPGTFQVDEVLESARENDLEITTTGALPPGTRFYGDDQQAIENAEVYMMDCLDRVKELGSPLFAGPIYKAVGDVDLSLPLDEQRKQTAQRFRPIAAKAAEMGIDLCFEALNRFETNFLNTVAQGIDFCQAIDSPAAKLLIDTFHMHIEEKSSPKAIKSAAKAGVIGHFHTAENDRGIPGSGQVKWKKVAKSLAKTGYDKWVILESFDQNCEAIRTAISCWRPFYPSKEAFLKEGLEFVKKLFKEKI